MTMTPTALRSVLFAPASNGRAIEKARTLACDAVILDLEDAVGPDDKATAREVMASVVPAAGFAAPLLAVRVNGADTAWAEADLRAAAAAAPDAVLIPKVASPDDLRAARAALPASIRLWANIETCLGVLEAREIAATAAEVGLDVLVFGQNDLSRDLGRRPSHDRRLLHTAMGLTVLAGRAAGLGLVDGVFNDFTDLDAFEAECREGRAFGFDGKAVIHPAQIEAANRVFSPGEEDLAWARAVVEAFADPANAGKGAVRASGGMAERLHLDQALRMIASSSR
jgi:citrate lyase subunit beta/citryl-CoA lyase